MLSAAAVKIVGVLGAASLIIGCLEIGGRFSATDAADRGGAARHGPPRWMPTSRPPVEWTRDERPITETAIEALLASGQLGEAQLRVQQDMRTTAWQPELVGALLAVSRATARLSPAEAGAWLRDLPACEERNSAIATLAEEWSATAPAAAMEWSASLATDQGRFEAMQRVFDRWTAHDATAAAQWLADHEACPAADLLICRFVSASQFVANTPELALQWAGLLSEPEARVQQVEAVIVAWSRRDAAAALNYVMESSLLTSAQKQLLERRLAAEWSPPATE